MTPIVLKLRGMITGGIVILECKNIEEAKAIAESDPFIKEGYKTFELRTLNIANKENNYGI